MSLEKLNHYSMENPASIYDEEAMTALELAGRTATKMNEVVQFANDTMRICGEHLSLQDEQIEAMKQTTDKWDDLDSEVTDGRVDVTGRTHQNIGTAIRHQFKNTALIRRELNINEDLDTITDTGVYFISSGNENINMPENCRGGILINYYTESTTRRYQILYAYDETVAYIRHYKQTQWSAWELMVTAGKLGEFTACVRGELPGGTDLDTIQDNSVYFLSSKYTYPNIPEGETGGMLTTYYNDVHRHYQSFVSYDTNTEYRRNAGNGIFSEWKEIGSEGSSEAGSDSKDVRIIQESATQFRIYFGEFNTSLQYTADSILGEGKGNWNLIGIRRDAVQIDGGGDILGPVRINDNSDEVGGVHGYENTNIIEISVGGKTYTNPTEELLQAEGDTLTLTLQSTIYDRATLDQCIGMTRNVRIVFSKNKMWVGTGFINNDSMTVNRATNGGLLSAKAEDVTSIVMDDQYLGGITAESYEWVSNYNGKTQNATINTKNGSMTIRNLSTYARFVTGGNEITSATPKIVAFTSETPPRLKVYFDTIPEGSGSSMLAGEGRITSQFEYLFS